MFRSAVLVTLQTLLFLLLFAAGAFLPALPTFSGLYWAVSTGPGRVFVMDGLLLTLAAYGLILLAEVLLKGRRVAGQLTSLALVLALCLGFAMRLGFKSI